MNTDNPKDNHSIMTLLFKILIWLGTIIIAIFIILPTIFILLGNVCPNYFSSNAAILQLNNRVNDLVGYCSLAVGIFSIVYAYLSNRRVEEQQHHNEEFLRQLSTKIDELQKSNSKLFDQVVNVQQSNTKKDTSQ